MSHVAVSPGAYMLSWTDGGPSIGNIPGNPTSGKNISLSAKHASLLRRRHVGPGRHVATSPTPQVRVRKARDDHSISATEERPLIPSEV